MNDFFKLQFRLWGILTAASFLGIIGSVAGFLGQFAWWLDIGSHFRIQYTLLFALLALCYLFRKKRPGALNVSPWSPHYQNFIEQSRLINSSQGRAIHPTWPTFSLLFLIPLDHFLHTANIAIKSTRVGKSIGSDHFPVIVEFGMKDAK